MKDYSDIIFGNRELLTILLEDAAKKTLAHAYIIEGERGSGKKTIVSLVLKALACESDEKPCLICDNCRRTEEKIVTDISYYSCPPGKKSIGIDTIREIKEKAYMTPQEFDFKAFVIENGEYMTVQAQNSFLKILEEPPRNVYFFLLCENSSQILATVKSRAPILRTEKFSFDTLSEYILKRSERARELYENSREDFNFEVRFAKGSVGALTERFNSSQTDEGLKRYESVKSALSLLCSGQRSEFLTLMSTQANDREEAVEILDCIKTALRDVLYVKVSEGDDIMFFISRKDAAAFELKFTLEEIVKINDICDVTISEIQSFVNLSAEMLKCAAEMWDTKH